MMLQILLHHFFRDVARTPCPVPDGPEVPPPVPLPQGWIFFLQAAAGAPLHPLDQVGERLRRRVLDVHMDLVFADYSFENPHVFSVADLHEQVAAAHCEVAFEDVVTVLRDHTRCAVSRVTV